MAGTSSGATSVARRPSVRDTTREPQGSPATGAPGSSRTSTPMRRMDNQQAGAPGVEVDPVQAHLGLAEQRPRHQVGGRRGEVAGHLDVRQGESRDRAHQAHRAALAQQRHARGLEHPLGVVARGRRLADPCGPLGEQTRQQDAALDLRARHREVVLDADQGAPARSRPQGACRRAR